MPPAEPRSAYHPLEPGVCLEGLLCFKYQRTVAKDNTVKLGEHTLQLLPGPERSNYARARVEIQERLGGSLMVANQGSVIASKEAPLSPVTLRARKNWSARAEQQDMVRALAVDPGEDLDQGSGAPELVFKGVDARPQAG